MRLAVGAPGGVHLTPLSETDLIPDLIALRKEKRGQVSFATACVVALIRDSQVEQLTKSTKIVPAQTAHGKKET